GFGVALQATEIGSVIERAFVGQAAASGTGSGLVFLFLGFGVASLIKLAQGSSTVAMITTAAMLAAMLPASGLPFHTVYVATAIASGSLVGTWMNDSGFWLFSKMGGVTEIETLKSWTPVLGIVGVTAMVRSEEHTSELQSRFDLVCRLLLEKKKINDISDKYNY